MRPLRCRYALTSNLSPAAGEGNFVRACGAEMALTPSPSPLRGEGNFERACGAGMGRA
jgi:hypothetical protein